MTDHLDTPLSDNQLLDTPRLDNQRLDAQRLDALLRRDLLDAVPLAGTARPPALDGEDVAYLVDDTAIGRLLLATRSDGVLVASSFAPSDAEADATLDRLARTVTAQILRRTTPSLDSARRQLAERDRVGDERGGACSIVGGDARALQHAGKAVLAAERGDKVEPRPLGRGGEWDHQRAGAGHALRRRTIGQRTQGGSAEMVVG